MQKTQNLQDIFLNQLRKDRSSVTMFLMNGFQLHGVIKGFDGFTVVLESDGKQQLIIVLINEQFSAQKVDLSGDFSAYSTMQIHETSTYRDLAKTYSGAVKTDVSVPMQSVITIVLSE